jgi:DNA-binding response OmpR family regulator
MEQHTPHTTRKKRILVVEDHLDTAELVSLILRDAGYLVRHLRNASLAFSFLSDECESSGECPDLVLLDLTMAGKDPVDMVAEVGPDKMPPIVIMSARQSSAISEAAHKLTAAGVIHKPFEVDDLLSCVQSALQQSYAQS